MSYSALIGGGTPINQVVKADPTISFQSATTHGICALIYAVALTFIFGDLNATN